MMMTLPSRLSLHVGQKTSDMLSLTYSSSEEHKMDHIKSAGESPETQGRRKLGQIGVR